MPDVIAIVAAPLGRILLSSIFIMSGIHKITAYEQTAQAMSAQKLPAVELLLPAAILVELAGGLSVLVGLWARWGALALFMFLIPTTLIFHNFWTIAGEEHMTQMTMFMKNIAIVGGLLMIVALGAGPLSFDARRAHSAPRP